MTDPTPPGDGGAQANEAALARSRQAAIRDNAKIRALQPEQIPLEDGRAKPQLGLVSAYVVNAIAFVLPIKLRVRFVFAINFLYNNVWASLRMVLASFGTWVTYGSIALAYFLVLGPTSVIARLFGADYLGERREPGETYFTAKEPPDTTVDRFSRQF